MKELSDKLKRARIDLNLGIHVLHQRTKIPITTIEAIENGEPIQVEKPYYRVFIRSIAKEVGLDGDQLLKELDKRESKRMEANPDHEEMAQIGWGLKRFIENKGRWVLFTGLALLFVIIGYGYIRYGKQIFIEPGIKEFQEIDRFDQFQEWSFPDTLEFKPFTLSLIALKSCHFIFRADSGEIESYMVNEEGEMDWNIKKYVTLGIDEPSHVILLINEIPITWEEVDSTSGINILITANGVIHQSLKEKE